MSVFSRLAAGFPPLFRGGISGLTWALAIILIAQVVFRYALNASLVWGEEFARYVMIFIVFVGAIPLVLARSLSAFSSGAPSTPLTFRIVGGLVRLAFYGAFGASAALLMLRSGAQRSIALEWPMAIVYAPMLVFALAASAVTLGQIFGRPADGTGEK